MVNKGQLRILIGIALIVAGLFSLLDVLDILDVGGLGWALVFVGAGAAFLYVFASNRVSNWWAVIPGTILAGLGVMIAASEFLPNRYDEVAAAIFMGSIGLAFLIVYLNNTNFWWAIIPMGVMFSIAGLIVLETLFRFDFAWLFLLGLAATFAVLAFIRVNGQRMNWPIWPAGALLGVSALVMITSWDLARFIWPVILILIGGVFVWRALIKRV